MRFFCRIPPTRRFFAKIEKMFEILLDKFEQALYFLIRTFVFYKFSGRC